MAEINALFDTPPDGEQISLAYMISVLLHKGFRYEYDWRTSVCSEPMGETVFMQNATFFSNHVSKTEAEPSYIRNILTVLKRYSDTNVLKVLFAVYELTLNDFGLYVSVEEICLKSRLSENDVTAAAAYASQ